MATWIKCTNTKHEVVYINLDNAVTVTRNDVADRIAGRGPNKYLERNCDSI